MKGDGQITNISKCLMLLCSKRKKKEQKVKWGLKTSNWKVLLLIILRFDLAEQKDGYIYNSLTTYPEYMNDLTGFEFF